MNTKKTYNILYTTAFSNMAGGGQWSLYYLIKHLDKDRFHPLVLCPEQGELSDNIIKVGAEPIFMKTGRMRSFNPFTIKKLVSIIKDRDIAIIHTDSTTETFYAGIAAKIMNIPLIWHIRASEGQWALDRLLSALSTKLILVASALIKRFKWLDKGKAPTVYNGIDLEEFDSFTSASSIREEFNIDKDTVLLACSGRLEERKGQEYLVSAMRNINNAKIIFAGKADETYFARIKQMCNEFDISERVIFAGHRKDVPALLREIDIFVFPVIRGEGFSRAVLEAMAAGKPVIATDDAGNPEAVIEGETGHIVPTKDTATLSEKIRDLINNKEKRTSMGVAGRGKVELNFNVKNIVRQIEKVYLDIL